MLITDWLFVDIKKLCDVFRYDNGVVVTFNKKKKSSYLFEELHA